jgi:hypothetical protein
MEPATFWLVALHLPVGEEFSHAEGHYEANHHFSQLHERAYKLNT